MKSTTTKKIKADNKYPGVAIDKADNEHVNPDLVKQETELLNDNPATDGE